MVLVAWSDRAGSEVVHVLITPVASLEVEAFTFIRWLQVRVMCSLRSRMDVSRADDPTSEMLLLGNEAASC